MRYASRLSVAIGVFFALFLFTGSARAQFAPMDPSMNPLSFLRDLQYGPLMLLARSEIQKELKLSKSQNEEIKKLQKEQMNLVKQQQSQGRGADAAQMMESFKKMQSEQAGFNTKAKAVLSEEQKQRFSEIRIQAIGIPAVFEPELQMSLGATAEQKGRLSALETEYTAAKMALMQDMQSMRNAGRFKSKQEAQDKEFKEKIATILTADQNILLKKKEGEPFKGIKSIKGPM